MAEMTVLYTERKEKRPGRQPVTDYVEVEIHKWSARGLTDVILERLVLVDGDLKRNERTILAVNRTDAQYIRAGIACFDAMVAEHPNLEVEEQDR